MFDAPETQAQFDDLCEVTQLGDSALESLSELKVLMRRMEHLGGDITASDASDWFENLQCMIEIAQDDANDRLDTAEAA